MYKLQMDKLTFSIQQKRKCRSNFIQWEQQLNLIYQQLLI